MSSTLSIRTRLTLLYTSLLFLSLVVFGTAALRLLRARLMDRVHASLAVRIQGVENFIRRETTAQTAHMIPLEIEEYAFTQPEGHLIRVTDEDGKLLLRSKQAPAHSVYQDDNFTIYSKTYHVRAWASLTDLEASLSELQWLLVVMTPFLLLLTAALGYWISGRALSPVDGMTRLARSIGFADLSRRVPVPVGARRIKPFGRSLERDACPFGRLRESNPAVHGRRGARIENALNGIANHG